MISKKVIEATAYIETLL